MAKSTLLFVLLMMVPFSASVSFAKTNFYGAIKAASAKNPSEAAITAKSKTTRASLAPGKVSFKKTNLMVLGDSLGDGVWAGLYNAFRKDKNIKVMRKTKPSTGFVRLDYYDWNARLTQILAKTRVDVAVVMVGANDRQTITTKSGRYRPGSRRWREIYASRVDDFIRQLKTHGAKVYWVGLPITRSKKFSRHMKILNEVFAERARANNITFVDIWNDFTTVNGNYSANGKDIKGRMRKLRANDGVHFTMRGYQKLAVAAERFIRAGFNKNTPPAVVVKLVKPQIKAVPKKIAAVTSELEMMAPAIIADVAVDPVATSTQVAGPEKTKILPVFQPDADYLAKNMQKSEETDTGKAIQQALANDFQDILSIVQPDKAVVATSRAAIAPDQEMQLSKFKVQPQHQQMRKTVTSSLSSRLPEQSEKTEVAPRVAGIVSPVSIESGAPDDNVEFGSKTTDGSKTIANKTFASIAPIPELDIKAAPDVEGAFNSTGYRALLRGNTVSPKAGRGDDFSWPRD